MLQLSRIWDTDLCFCLDKLPNLTCPRPRKKPTAAQKHAEQNPATAMTLLMTANYTSPNDRSQPC